MKRTKRYGGFLVGDKVQRKDGLFKELQPGVVVAMRLGRLTVQWVDLNGKTFRFCYMPNQLINLTRQEEENFRHADPVRLPSDESVQKLLKSMKELNKYYLTEENLLKVYFDEPTCLNPLVSVGTREFVKKIRFSPSDLPQPVEEL